ncbi:MAG TPA: GNAT family N-acetyltransferase [Acidimicrobiales bacterium]|jgi:ribosomal protein S18 acetylase RimI-like enzyme|nr:GNAT family N-acetyltransferase [Acidimicrobiales bacterium]
MTSAITVREVRPEEYDRLAELTVAAYVRLLGDDLDRGYVAELADVADRAAKVDVLVATDERGLVVGGITYIAGPGPLAWFDGDDVVGLRMLAVAPEAQRRGVGAALIAACVERARAAGKRRILLHTTDPMTTAHRLYERSGFRRDPERDEVFGAGLRLLAYAMELAPGQ